MSEPTPSPLRPAGRSGPAVALFIGVALLFLAGDLWLKAWSFEHVASTPVRLTRGNAGGPEAIPFHEPVTVVPHVLSLRLTTNIGAVFGLGKGAQLAFIVVSLIVVPVLVRVFARSGAADRVFHAALALILAGDLGNLYDRVRFNAVRDMLYLFPGVTLPFGLSWPGGNDEVYPWIFNLADVALVVGVATLMVILWRQDRRARTAPAAPG